MRNNWKKKAVVFLLTASIMCAGGGLSTATVFAEDTDETVTSANGNTSPEQKDSGDAATDGGQDSVGAPSGDNTTGDNVVGSGTPAEGSEDVSGGDEASSGAVELNGKAYETLQAAIDAAQTGDTIILTQDFTATGEEKPAWADWMNEVRAARVAELTIDLNGHTVDCGGEYSWLCVNSGNTGGMVLTVKNGTIQNTAGGIRGTNQGSAIWAFGTLNLEGVTFSNCSAPSYGGAVYVGTSNTTTVVAVDNCVFENCAGENGGALAIFMAKNVEIKNTKFRNNSSAENSSGGAIYVDHGAEGVTLANCEFTGNTASYGGAVAAYDNCVLQVEGCDFEGNNATVGGAVLVQGISAANIAATLTASNTSFTNNTASSAGGAVYGYYLYPSSLTGVTFTGNQAANGGAAYLVNARMAITNTEVTGNEATGLAGGLYLQSAPSTISGGRITGNKAGTGGGIVNYFATLVLTDSAAVHNNVAVTLGDDIYSSDAGYHETNPAKLVLNDAASVKLESDGKDITGWFIDGQKGDATERWGALYEEYDGEASVVALKAAHSQYFTVTYTDGVEGVELFADQITDAVSGSATPAFDGTPTRVGNRFTGWSPAVAETVTADVTYTAQWERIPEEPSEPTIPYYPDRPSTPDEEIDDEDTPLTSAPEESGEEIVDEETPLVSAPTDEERIDDENVPLVDAPKTGVMAGGAVATLAAASAAAVLLGKKRRK